MSALRQEITEQLGNQFCLALEGMLGESWPSSLPETVLPGDNSQFLCWSQKLSVFAEPGIQVAISPKAWREIGSRALAAVGLENPEESDIRATYVELLTQALAGLARYLTSKIGSEVTLDSGTEIPTPSAGNSSPFRCIHLQSAGGPSADLFVRLEPAFLQAVENLLPDSKPAAQASSEKSAPKSAEPAAVRAAAAGSASGGASGGGQSSAVPQPPTMDLLLDVEMPVSVSFGRTHLQLKEVIKLSTGSIIELNKTISEPVEVIVNNCVIARGEVVVIEGNYGVRIQQIVSRAERLRTMD